MVNYLRTGVLFLLLVMPGLAWMMCATFSFGSYTPRWDCGFHPSLDLLGENNRWAPRGVSPRSFFPMVGPGEGNNPSWGPFPEGHTGGGYPPVGLGISLPPFSARGYFGVYLPTWGG